MQNILYRYMLYSNSTMLYNTIEIRHHRYRAKSYLTRFLSKDTSFKLCFNSVDTASHLVRKTDFAIDKALLDVFIAMWNALHFFSGDAQVNSLEADKLEDWSNKITWNMEVTLPQTTLHFVSSEGVHDGSSHNVQGSVTLPQSFREGLSVVLDEHVVRSTWRLTAQ